MQLIERVMQTYVLLVTLTPEQEALARERVTKFLEGRTGDDHILTIEAIKFLRGAKAYRRRRPLGTLPASCRF